MDKRRMNHITAGFIVVMALVIAVMFGNNLRPPHVVLPDPSDTGEQTEEEGAGSGSLALVEVTPETVQTAIATLDRPAQYRRSITIEQFWDGGSGTYEVNVLAYGRWTRTDRTMPDGRARHTITNGETTYIWYDGDREAFSAPAAGISADNEQTIPTYEDVLELPVEAIAQADYRVISEVNCIYVETGELAGGIVLRYWVSVETGLLVASERLLEGETILYGGGHRDDPDSDSGWIAPTLVADTLDRTSKPMGEEIFGPILPIIPYDGLDQAIHFVNRGEKPLALYLFTRSEKTKARVLNHCSFGGGCVNDTIIHLATHHMGFGGVGYSGMGSYHGRKSFDTFSHYRAIVDKATWIDLPMRYQPYTKVNDKLIRMFLR